MHTSATLILLLMFCRMGFSSFEFNIFNQPRPKILSRDCESDQDCLSFESCQKSKCKLCSKQDVICGSGWPCCENTSCVHIPNLGVSMCKKNQNKCRTDSDCTGGLHCLIRLGKCGICLTNGERCTLPHYTYECCSSYCAMHLNETVCADPSIPPI